MAIIDSKWTLQFAGKVTNVRNMQKQREHLQFIFMQQEAVLFRFCSCWLDAIVGIRNQLLRASQGPGMAHKKSKRNAARRQQIRQ
jgi:hypothetical protein